MVQLILTHGKYARSEATISSVLAAAEKLFLARNYADVSMRDIARQAGVTTGALYHHFESKEALYVSMLRTDFSAKRKLLRAALQSGAPATENLRRLLQVFVDLPRSKRDLMHLVRRDVNRFDNPARNRIVRAYQSALPDLVENVIAVGIEVGEIRPGSARILAWHLVAILEVALSPFALRNLSDEQAVVEHVMELFLEGVAV